MLGKKKKTEAPAEQNDLDKPQTLAELDAMAREKKEDKVTLQDADGDGEPDPSDKELDHEVSHTDEITVDTDVKKVTGSQRKLWVLVGIACMALTFGGTMFYLQLEDGGSIGVGAGGSEVTVSDLSEEEVADLVPRGTFAYVAEPGQSAYKRHKVSEEGQDMIDVGVSIPDASGSLAFQISSNSLVSAVKTTSGIVVKNLDKQETYMAEQVGSVRQWILIPDGTKIVALIGNDLHVYDTSSGQGGEVSKSFTPSGSDVSNLAFSRDGRVHQYAKSGKNLTGNIFNMRSGETTPVSHEVIRLDQMGPFDANSISPDGSAIAFKATISGRSTLQLLSLNSFVLRTIYVAESGNNPSQFKWSEDSNNIAVYESGVAPNISNLKVGTLEKELLQSGISSAVNLSWSDDKKFIGFINGGKLRSIDVESKELVDVVDSVSAQAITGWIQN